MGFAVHVYSVQPIDPYCHIQLWISFFFTNVKSRSLLLSVDSNATQKKTGICENIKKFAQSNQSTNELDDIVLREENKKC